MLDAYDSRKQKLCHSIALVQVLLAKRKTMSKAKAKGYVCFVYIPTCKIDILVTYIVELFF